MEESTNIERFLTGLGHFANLSADEMMAYIEANRSDALCMIRHPAGQGEMMCTREGYEALRASTDEQLKRRPDWQNFDNDELFSRVRNEVGPFLRTVPNDTSEMEQLFAAFLEGILERLATEQKSRIFHFPCVLVGSADPRELAMGPVKFSTAAAFWLYVESAKQKGKRADEIDNPEFRKYVSEFGSVASIKVPPMAARVGQTRAELAGRTAINIVRIWFGQAHSQRIRIVHTEPATANQSHYAVEDDEELTTTRSRTFEGASVHRSWIEQAISMVGHRNAAGWLLADIVSNKSSEFSERLIDALSWFGDAAFEPSPGARIAKFVTSLERMTTFENRFSKKRFCRRVAILSQENDADLEEKYWAAYDFYNARSAVVHGAESQSRDNHWRALKNAEKILTTSLFSGFEIYALTRFANSPGPRTVQGFFNQQENLYSERIKVLEIEFGKREKARGL